MECVKCACVWLGARWKVMGSGWKDLVLFWLYQSCGNRGSVGRVCVAAMWVVSGRVGGVLGRVWIWKGGVLLCMCVL